ncbi:hypothetical protein SBA2_860022 [Acidobacteriia bacterium SbA2]|nr:hypothetical protein SBA2_860022 [Acidobacteriia bacterium SbA2]
MSRLQYAPDLSDATGNAAILSPSGWDAVGERLAVPASSLVPTRVGQALPLHLSSLG